MFISATDIKDTTGYDIDANTVRVAQLMVETYVGRSEVEVNDAGDLVTLGRATLFQAIYIYDSLDSVLEQAAVKSITIGETATTFDTDLFAPYMAPLAVWTCRKLSWFGSRSIHTGPLFDRYQEVRWETA